MKYELPAGRAVLPEVEQLGNGQVLLRGRAVVRVASGMKAAVALVAGRDGGHVDRELAVVLRALEVEAKTYMSEGPHAIWQNRGVSGGSVIEPMSTEEVAMILEMTPRHVRRLAQQLGGYRLRGRWIFDRAAVAAAAEDRRAA